MRSLVRKAVAVALAVGPRCFLTSVAEADPSPVGLEIALGFGLTAPATPALPEHSYPADGGPTLSGGLPITIDAGLRTRRFFVGPVLQAAPLLGCCEATDVQVGGEARFYTRPDETSDPWFGAGAAYELATESGGNYSGWTLNALAGVDLKADAADAAAIGPFLSVSFGRYTHASEDSSFQALGLHEWFTVGLRVVWDPR
jgi:hypothetical protein